MKTYKWNAKDYESHSQSQQKWAKELIQKLRLKGSENVLDIGCGDGKVTAEIATLVTNGSALGIDNSESMIELAKKKFSGSDYSNLSYQVKDVRSMSYDERFDVVFSNAALHWVKNHKPVLEKIFKGLKNGGQILLQMGGEGNAQEILTVLSKLISSKEWQPFFQNFDFPYEFYGIQEYRKLLSETGFKINRVDLVPKDMIHDQQSDLEGWIRTTWLPYIERVPNDKKDHFIKTICSKYIEEDTTDREGRIHVAMVRLEVEAERI